MDEEDGYERPLRLIAIGIGIAALVSFGIMTSLREPPPPPPDNSVVFGCYTSEDAPAILLDASGMHILQPDFPTIGYHLDRGKHGISLTAEAPIFARAEQSGYRFGISERGTGYYLPFYRVINGRVYGVFDDELLSGFRMTPRSGHMLPYSPADPGDCAVGAGDTTAEI